MPTTATKAPEKPRTLITAYEIERALIFVYSIFLRKTRPIYVDKANYTATNYQSMIHAIAGDTFELIDTLDVAAQEWADAHTKRNKKEAAQIEAILHQQATIMRNGARECTKHQGDRRCRTVLHRIPTCRHHPGAHARHKAHVPEQLLTEWRGQRPAKKKKKK